MLESITNMRGYLKNIEMETIWNLIKEDPKKMTETEKKQRKEAIQKKIGDIETRLKSGKRLSDKEMRLLREHAPELYKKAMAAEMERKNLKEELKRCRTKDDVQRVFSQKLQSCLQVAKNDQQLAEIVTAAVRDEHGKFTKSDTYKQMQWQGEVEKVSKRKSVKKEPQKTMDDMYQEMLQYAKDTTWEISMSPYGKPFQSASPWEQIAEKTELQGTAGQGTTGQVSYGQATAGYESSAPVENTTRFEESV